MSGRVPNPGEKDVFSLIDQRAVKNRTLRAQVTAVNYENGVVTFNLDSSPAGGKVATVAPLWASFPMGGGAAWGRYMPQASDILKVSFDYDDSPRIVGYDIAAEKDGMTFGRVGWPALASLHNRAVGDPSTKINVTDSKGNTTQVSIAKYGQFVPLRPGEYDFMSSGGAYIHGDENGRLYLAGGTVSVSLVKNDQLIEQYSQCWNHHADDCIFRFGQVRRPDPVDTIDKTVLLDQSGTFKEFSVRLKNTITPGTSLDLATIQLGNVVVDSGQSTEKLNGIDIGFLLRTFNTGAQVFQMAADTSGNCQIDNNSSFVVNAPAIKLQGLNGAPAATHPLILTQVYEPAEKQLVNGLVAQINALTSQVNAMAAALTTLGGSFVLEVPAGVGLIANMVPVLSALASLPASTTAVGNVFTSGYDSYLSTISKTA
jgi:hypothetical protein